MMSMELDSIENSNIAMKDSDAGSVRSSSQGTMTPPAFSTSNRIFFVCFHLPVVVVKNERSGQWRGQSTLD
jgi:hypothetical protein